MLEKFRLISTNGNLIEPNLTGDLSESLFSKVTSDEYLEYINNSTKGIKWDFKGREVEIFEIGNSIYGCPTPDMKKVIVIFPLNNSRFPSPNNAALYNEDGTVLSQLSPPKLISDIAKKYYSPGNINPGTINLFFRNVSWRFDSKGKLVISIQICFSRDYFESRVFDSDTLEFGDCLTSGRN